MRFAKWPLTLALLLGAPCAFGEDLGGGGARPEGLPAQSAIISEMPATLDALSDGEKRMLTAMAIERKGQGVDSVLVNGPILLDVNNDESVYAPAALPTENDLYNQGGVNLNINVTYLNRYIFRGIDRNAGVNDNGKLNLQPDFRVTFNLGEKAPHPFLGIFVNVFNSDPISRFQEIRPYFGLTWQLRPVIFEIGNNSYIYPEREGANSGEVYGRVTLMDEAIFKTDEPLLRPYVYAAYDYDKYDGLYLEVGVQHVFKIEKTGLSITASGLASYVNHHAFFIGEHGETTGLQRYQAGLVASYNLNGLLNISRRYGQWSVNAYANYTNRIGNQVRTDKKFWGGGGIEFNY